MIRSVSIAPITPSFRVPLAEEILGHVTGQHLVKTGPEISLYEDTDPPELSGENDMGWYWIKSLLWKWENCPFDGQTRYFVDLVPGVQLMVLPDDDQDENVETVIRPTFLPDTIWHKEFGAGDVASQWQDFLGFGDPSIPAVSFADNPTHFAPMGFDFGLDHDLYGSWDRLHDWLASADGDGYDPDNPAHQVDFAYSLSYQPRWHKLGIPPLPIHPRFQTSGSLRLVLKAGINYDSWPWLHAFLRVRVPHRLGYVVQSEVIETIWNNSPAPQSMIGTITLQPNEWEAPE